jgi:hypothetical protein
MNGLGCNSRETGQRREPAPPHKTVGISFIKKPLAPHDCVRGGKISGQGRADISSDCPACSLVVQMILAAFQKHIHSATEASGNGATAKRIRLPQTSMLWDNQELFLFAKKKS